MKSENKDLVEESAPVIIRDHDEFAPCHRQVVFTIQALP